MQSLLLTVGYTAHGCQHFCPQITLRDSQLSLTQLKSNWVLSAVTGTWTGQGKSNNIQVERQWAASEGFEDCLLFFPYRDIKNIFLLLTRSQQQTKVQCHRSSPGEAMSSLVGAVSRSMNDPVAEALEGLHTAAMMAFLWPGGQSLLQPPSTARVKRQ